MPKLDRVGVKRLWIWNTRGKANFYTWHPYRQIVSIPYRYGTPMKTRIKVVSIIVSIPYRYGTHKPYSRFNPDNLPVVSIPYRYGTRFNQKSIYGMAQIVSIPYRYGTQEPSTDSDIIEKYQFLIGMEHL